MIKEKGGGGGGVGGGPFIGFKKQTNPLHKPMWDVGFAFLTINNKDVYV